MANYITIAEGDAFLAGELNSSAWDAADSAEKQKAITTATRAIDRLAFCGYKTVDTQTNEFPRNDEVTIPQGIKDATALEALALLDGKDPELEWENQFMTTQGFANARSAYDRSSKADNIISGIMSIKAWNYLLPYLNDPNTIKIERLD
jgi:hypothetical protein